MPPGVRKRFQHAPLNPGPNFRSNLHKSRTLTPPDDHTILNLLKQPATRERGFRLLMDAYQERLYRHVRRIVHTHADADDALQNAFIKVFRSVEKFRGQSKLYTWLYRIATNEAITVLQQRKKRSTADFDDEEIGLENRLTADPHFNGDAAQIILYRAIETLPDKQREVFRLRYFEEMPYAEMSDLLDTSVGALKASYHHAVKKVESYVSAQV